MDMRLDPKGFGVILLSHTLYDGPAGRGWDPADRCLHSQLTGTSCTGPAANCIRRRAVLVTVAIVARATNLLPAFCTAAMLCHCICTAGHVAHSCMSLSQRHKVRGMAALKVDHEAVVV